MRQIYENLLGQHPHIALAVPWDQPRFAWLGHRDFEWQRTPLWWAIFSFVALCLTLFSVLTEQWFLLGSVGVIVMGYVYLHQNPTPPIWITLSDMWVYYDTRFFQYSDIETFSLVHPFSGVTFLKLELKQSQWVLHHTTLLVLVEGQNVRNLLHFLRHHVLEDRAYKVSILQYLLWILKL